MSCNPLAVGLPAIFAGDTWDGLTWRIDYSDPDDTEFAGTLALVRMQWQDDAGNVLQTLSSATAGQITINDAAPRQWDVTVEPRVLGLTAGTYSWALEFTDNTGMIKTLTGGTQRILADPVK